jgi:hypothetical protein
VYNSCCTVASFDRDAAESWVPSTTWRNAVSSSYCIFWAFFSRQYSHAPWIQVLWFVKIRVCLLLKTIFYFSLLITKMLSKNKGLSYPLFSIFDCPTILTSFSCMDLFKVECCFTPFNVIICFHLSLKLNWVSDSLFVSILLMFLDTHNPPIPVISPVIWILVKLQTNS